MAPWLLGPALPNENRKTGIPEKEAIGLLQWALCFVLRFLQPPAGLLLVAELLWRRK
jgi:hypothetical protein